MKPSERIGEKINKEYHAVDKKQLELLRAMIEEIDIISGKASDAEDHSQFIKEEFEDVRRDIESIKNFLSI